MRVTLGGVEVTKAEVNSGELALRASFIWLVPEQLGDSQTFLHAAKGFLEVMPGGSFVAPRTGSLAFRLANDADVLRHTSKNALIIQLQRHFAGLFIPRPSLGGTT